VAACSTGAIEAHGKFNFAACYTHNYREFMGGFTNWVETIAESKSAKDYGNKVTDSESVSMWQACLLGRITKQRTAWRCAPQGKRRLRLRRFSATAKGYWRRWSSRAREARDRYVVPGSDAEGHVVRRFPQEQIKRVGNGLRVGSIGAFLRGLPLTFQPKQAEELDATYHFTFTGEGERKATVTIREQTLRVEDGHTGAASLRVVADSRTWLGFLRKERSFVWAFLTRKIRLQGSPRLLAAFGRCFPS
jgi:hypothetical protein